MEKNDSSDGDSDWQDLEPDEELAIFTSFFDEQTFPTAPAMLAHAKKEHSFDFLNVASRLKLDFYGAIKLVNFVRTCHQKGQPLPADILSTHFEDDVYLKPVLDNDTFLYNLDEILPEPGQTVVEAAGSSGDGVNIDQLLTRNKDLEGELETLRDQFASYRLAVEQTLDRRWGVDDAEEKPSDSGPTKDNSDYYFESYAFHGKGLDFTPRRGWCSFSWGPVRLTM